MLLSSWPFLALGPSGLDRSYLACIDLISARPIGHTSPFCPEQQDPLCFHPLPRQSPGLPVPKNAFGREFHIPAQPQNQRDIHHLLMHSLFAHLYSFIHLIHRHLLNGSPVPEMVLSAPAQTTDLTQGSMKGPEREIFKY